MLEELDASADFLQRMVFSDKVTFHISDYANLHNHIGTTIFVARYRIQDGLLRVTHGTHIECLK